MGGIGCRIGTMEVEVFTNGMAEDDGYEVDADIVSAQLPFLMNHDLNSFNLSGIQNLDVICGDMMDFKCLPAGLVFGHLGTGL